MKNFFSEFNGVTLTFSDIEVQDNVLEYIDVLLTRPHGNHLDYIFTRIPGFEVLESKGFTQKEIDYWILYTMKDSALIWDVAREIKGEWLA